MTTNQTMFHHVWPQHFYSHDGTCTRSSLCRIPLSLVEFHICYLLNRAIIHEMSALMTIFLCIIRYLHPLWISFSLYIVRGDDHMWHIFVYYAYSWPLYSYVFETPTCIFVVTCWALSLYWIDEFLVLPPGSSLLHFWDGYNVFWPSCYPSDLTH